MYTLIVKYASLVLIFMHCGNVFYSIVDGRVLLYSFGEVKIKSYYKLGKELNDIYMLNVLYGDAKIHPPTKNESESSTNHEIFVVFSEDNYGYLVKTTPSFIRQCFLAGSIESIVYPLGKKWVKKVILEDKMDVKLIGTYSHTVNRVDVHFIPLNNSTKFATLYIGHTDIIIIFENFPLEFFNIVFPSGMVVVFEYEKDQDVYSLKHKPILSLLNILKDAGATGLEPAASSVTG